MGRSGLLVNNASIFQLDRLETADRDSWVRHIEINLRAPIVLTQGFVAQLPARAEGVVVNMLDQRVGNLTPNFLSYSVSKVGPVGGDPGPGAPAGAASPRERHRPRPGTEAGRGKRRGLAGAGKDACRCAAAATPEEIMAALRFILDARSMTGQLITLDGGMQMGWLTPGIKQLD